ncbi:hypothetical protein MTR_4g036185 [Medicago truncatula]|nr:hypothetical protein MTR_4g036185 [Medicago truncatula]
MSPVFKKTNFGTVACFILIVIDANAGSSFSELFGIVSKFKKGLSNSCNIVWLDNQHMHHMRPLFMGTCACKDHIVFDHEYCIVGLCQALNDVLDSMGKKGIPVPV